MYLRRWTGWAGVVRFGAGFAIAAGAICLPFLLPPHPDIFAMFDNIRLFHDGVASLSAFNLWWFSARFQNAAAPYLGPLSPLAIGWALFGLTIILLVRAVWRDSSPATLFFAAGILALASFVLTVMQLERYLYPAVILFLFAAAYRPRYLRYALVAGATFFANAAIIVLINVHRLPWLDGGFWERFPDPYYWPWAVTLLVASTNVALLAVALLNASHTPLTAMLAGLRARVRLRPSAGGSAA
jgi:hypothetical protein